MKRIDMDFLYKSRLKRTIRRVIWSIFPPDGIIDQSITAWKKRLFQKPYRFKEVERQAELSYKKWISGPEKSLLSLTRHIPTAQPLISIFLPISADTPRWAVHTSLQSIIRQNSQLWQVFLPESFAYDPLLKEISDEMRAKLTFLPLEKSCFREWCRLADGEFVCSLMPGDILSNQFVNWISSSLEQHPDVDIFYFDIDMLSTTGERNSPFFKPDCYSPELLLSVNYLAHGLVRKRVALSAISDLITIEGFVEQEWNWMFACSRLTGKIFHIPAILYHQAQRASQVTESILSEVLTNHLSHLGRQAPEAHLEPSGNWRVTWENTQETVSIIIPTRDKIEVLSRCICSILEKTDYSRFEIILVDNSSVEPETFVKYEALIATGRVKIVELNEPFNYSKANNLGARHANGNILLFLNNDIEVIDPEWLQEMTQWAVLPEIAIVGAQLLYPNQTIQHAGIVLGLLGFTGHVYAFAPKNAKGFYGEIGWYRNFSAVTGACQMMRRSIFEELGGYDERYRLVFSDVAICMNAISRSYRVLYTPFARLIHYERNSRGRSDPIEDFMVGYTSYKELILSGDPYYNPNLSDSLYPMMQNNPYAKLEQRFWLEDKYRAAVRGH